MRRLKKDVLDTGERGGLRITDKHVRWAVIHFLRIISVSSSVFRKRCDSATWISA